MLKHSVSIKTFAVPTLRQVLNSMRHFALLPARGMEIINISFPQVGTFFLFGLKIILFKHNAITHELNKHIYRRLAL